MLQEPAEQALQVECTCGWNPLCKREPSPEFSLEGLMMRACLLWRLCCMGHCGLWAARVDCKPLHCLLSVRAAGTSLCFIKCLQD